MHDLIFVYGSLLSHMRHPKGDQLRRDGDLIGRATVRGRLYRVSWYPGVTLSEAPLDQVHGELYRLADPVASLAWLDEYEGITFGPAGVAPADQYERRQVSVSLDDGTSHDAWIYLYRLAVTDLVRVPSGRWTTDV